MSLVHHAYNMAVRGYKVFPLVEGGKVPAYSGWQHHATDDLQQIDYLWSANPNFNIGVLTNGFVVADLDTAKDSNVVSAFVSRGGSLDNTFTVRTPSGGYHCYYSSGERAGYERSYHQAINKLATGLDIKSYHNYVVGPGSRTSKGEYTVVGDRPVSRIPVGIETDLRPAGQPLTRDDSAQLDQPHNVALAREYLATVPPAVEGMGGDNHTFSVAAKVTRDYAISPDMAYQIMQEWNARCNPPWEADALYNKIVNANAYGQNDLGKRTPEAMFGNIMDTLAKLPAPATIPPMPTAQVAPQEAEPIDAFDFSKLDFGNNVPIHKLSRRKWKVDNLLLEDQVTVLGGAGGTGKSTLELVFAAHFSLGHAVGPYRPLRPLKLMMYNAEDNIEEQTKRLYATCIQYKLDFTTVMQNIVLVDSTQTDLMFLAEANRRLVFSKANIENMQNFIVAKALDVVMIDPMANIHSVPESDTTSMQRLMTLLRQMTQRTHTAFLVAHHVNKSTGSRRNKDSMDSFRGSSTVPNATRNSLLLSPVDADDIKDYDIPPKEAKDWVRLSVVKSNVAAKRTTFFKLEIASIAVDSGTYAEKVAVLQYRDVKRRDEVEEQELVKTVRATSNGQTFYDVAAAILVDEGTGGIHLQRLIERMRDRLPDDQNKSASTFNRLFKDRVPKEGVKTSLGLIKVVKEGKSYLVTLE